MCDKYTEEQANNNFSFSSIPMTYPAPTGTVMKCLLNDLICGLSIRLSAEKIAISILLLYCTTWNIFDIIYKSVLSLKLDRGEWVIVVSCKLRKISGISWPE